MESKDLTPYLQMIREAVEAIARETALEPVDVGGVCPEADLICQRGCQVVCGDAPEPARFRVGDVVRITSGDAYGDGAHFGSLVGRVDVVEAVGHSHHRAGGRSDLVDLERSGLWVPEGLELVRRAG